MSLLGTDMLIRLFSVGFFYRDHENFVFHSNAVRRLILHASYPDMGEPPEITDVNMLLTSERPSVSRVTTASYMSEAARCQDSRTAAMGLELVVVRLCIPPKMFVSSELCHLGACACLRGQGCGAES